jgi:hypothetical protein
VSAAPTEEEILRELPPEHLPGLLITLAAHHIKSTYRGESCTGFRGVA